MMEEIAVKDLTYEQLMRRLFNKISMRSVLQNVASLCSAPSCRMRSSANLGDEINRIYRHNRSRHIAEL
ncbi:MAG: hypothetical protein WCV59_03565, partial [Parcubacteria group bacterium]